MPFKTILNNIGGTIKTVTEFVEDEVIDPISNQLEYGVNEFKQGNPAPVLNAMSLGMSGAMAPLTQAVRGVDKTEGTLLESAGNYVEDKTGIPSLVTQVAAGVLIPGPGEYKAAGKSIARGVKKAFPLEGVDNIFPPTPPAALATAGAAPRVQLNVSGGKANLSPRVMKAASTLPTPTNWQNRARDLYGKQEHKALADTFRRGQGGKLSTKNTFITADELALNKDGVLDQALERADRMENLRKKWSEQGKEIKGDRQRELYDAASLNPNVPDIEMYTSDEARKFITKFTNVLSKDQWHHVFGNKEAGEFILSIANSDPLVAVNLFKKMEVLGLNSSGVSQNIAILKEAKHTNWHNFIKDMGMEPKSPGKALSVKGSTAPGDFADLSQEMGRAIAAGKGNINDAFELIELYAKYNNWMKKQITSERFGGRIISDLPEGVGKAIQIGGYRKRPAKSKYKPLPPM
ncbi:MAG: hypothetical protein KJO69_09375 [Gammaproteobacteria bacterium]|nr:hypothetical protein [Gammaproteobacteria bacterium]